MNHFELEICTAAVQSVISADRAGAHRVELCDNLYEGGTTPSLGLLLQVKEQTSIDVYPIIRVRGGDFCYNKDEIEIMRKDIRLFREYGADGIVIGCLTAQGKIDYEASSRLIEEAKGLPITFHRAFDMCENPYEALDVLKRMSVQRILTSGGENTAVQGQKVLKQLVSDADGKIKIMVGSGVDETNIKSLAEYTGANCFHASLRRVFDGAMQYRKEGVFMGGLKQIPEFENKFSDEERIKKCLSELRAL